MSPPDSTTELPAVDERLVAPETRYEIIDGRVVYVPPADQPHAESHAELAALVHAHRADEFSVAVDMLTRTSRIEDFAPDVSVYPTARDPRTGGRQLEQLAFEIASTESLGHAGTKAAKLIARGVRRVFAIDVERNRALEWSTAIDAWSILDRRDVIADSALAVPLPVAALLDAAIADHAVAAALRARRHPEFVAERAEGHVEGSANALLVVLRSRGFEVTADERTRIVGERDPDRLDRWLGAAVACTSVAALLAMP